MAANDGLSELEWQVLTHLKHNPRRTADYLGFEFRHVWTRREVELALISLIGNNHVVGSHDGPVRYSVVETEQYD